MPLPSALRLSAPLAIAVLACCLPALTRAQQVLVAARGQQVAAASLAELSLQELSELPVTSVSGHPESLRSAPASVFVISGEDIRRSAATSLPEALRLAPNLQVARLNSGQYAISARGFNNAIANKLLVLIDGRTIYSTLFSGVFWDFHDIVLEDIERIEVISGPGGTLWGANAVNGIINVITKSAAATQGTLVGVTRSHHGGQETARFGGRFGDAGHYRVYALAIDRDNSYRADGVERPDAATKHQLGFRVDNPLPNGQFTLQGDLYRGGDDPANGLAPKMHGGNVLGRWESHFDNGSPYRIQAYYDLAARDEQTTFRNRAESVDVQFTHEPLVGPGKQLMWGLGWRSGQDTNDPSPLLAFIPAERRLNWFNVFAQHQQRFGPWQLTAGLKLERNSYTGLEVLPNLRLAYEHAGQATTWASLSRTVRAPARIDRDFYIPARAPYLIAGGSSFESEVANVVELGHRGQAGRDLSYSATLFRQNYQGLRGGDGVPVQVANRIDGHIDGLEAWAKWQPMDRARFTVGYLGLRKSLHFAGPPFNPTSIANLGDDPREQWSLRSQFDLPHRTEFDFQVRHVGALPAPLVPAYTVTDARLGWQATPEIEVSLLAQNLFDKRHAEFNAANVASQFGRRLFLKVVFQL